MKNREYKRKWYLQYKQKKDPNYKPQAFHDFETHRELAINSGINGVREWRECYKLGLFPDGIYRDPDRAFNPEIRTRRIKAYRKENPNAKRRSRGYSINQAGENRDAT